ncbi:hypothetical protein ACNVED_03675 [Legionella sp. D16C41]|uniref:hypothetical protein n=1 Tax=Legionella sp. D16C41 TaxID=3402688 RepID=UPI003AF49642
MSRLQEFITKLGRVIIHYAETQTSQTYNTEEILKKPHSLLVDELSKLVQQAVTYETRRSCLNYFIYVINELKPLTEKEEPLSESETLVIKETLKNFLLTLFELLDIRKDTKVQLKYNNVDTEAARFISRWNFHREKALSIMGETVTNYLVNNISAKTSEEVTLYIETIVNEHQNILLVPILTNKLEQLKIEKDLIAQELKKTLEDNKNLNELLVTETKSNSAKDEQITQLEKKSQIQQETIQAAENQINDLKSRQSEAEELIAKLQTEKKQIQENTGPQSILRSAFYPNLAFFPGGAPNRLGLNALTNNSPTLPNASTFSPRLSNIGNTPD